MSARWLFGVAAAFNFSVGLGLLFLRAWLAPILRLDQVEGANLVFVNIVGGLIVVFGYAYVLVARDPVRYRPYIPLGVLGKLVAVVAVLIPWFAGQVFWTLPMLASVDVVFAVLFLLFLRRTARPGVGRIFKGDAAGDASDDFAVPRDGRIG